MIPNPSKSFITQVAMGGTLYFILFPPQIFSHPQNDYERYSITTSPLTYSYIFQGLWEGFYHIFSTAILVHLPKGFHHFLPYETIVHLQNDFRRSSPCCPAPPPPPKRGGGRVIVFNVNHLLLECLKLSLSRQMGCTNAHQHGHSL